MSVNVHGREVFKNAAANLCYKKTNKMLVTVRPHLTVQIDPTHHNEHQDSTSLAIEILIFQLLLIQSLWEFIIWQVRATVMSPKLGSNQFVYNLNRVGHGLWNPSPNRVSLAFRKERAHSILETQ